MKNLRITHIESNVVVAEGPKGWGITPFEGNYYIRRKYLKTNAFKVNYIPGICPYKFLYVWMNLKLPDKQFKNAAWFYWLPNPIFPFIWFRVAIYGYTGEYNIGYI